MMEKDTPRSMSNTSMTCSITIECANTEFQKARIQPPNPVQKSDQMDRSKYCHFHREHGYNTDDCIQLKDVIKLLIKKDILSKYVKGTKGDREESPKAKSLTKDSEVGPSGDKIDTIK